MANSHQEIKDNLDSLEHIIKPPKPLGENLIYRNLISRHLTSHKFIIPLGLSPLKTSFDVEREKLSVRTKPNRTVNKSTESTVEKITSNNQKHLQTSSEEKIPQLKKAVKTLISPVILNKSNINISKSINTSKSIEEKHPPINFGSSSPQNKLSHTNATKNNHQLSSNNKNSSSQTRPSSWSSVAELVGDVRASSNKSINNKSSYSQSNLRNLPTILRKSIPHQSKKNNSSSHSISTENNYTNVTSIGNNTLIQRKNVSVGEEDTVTLGNQPEGEQNGGIENKKNLEVLAREIYSLVRQRLQIERERRGDSYSGRLP